jgi:hypothetical protein
MAVNRAPKIAAAQRDAAIVAEIRGYSLALKQFKKRLQ